MNELNELLREVVLVIFVAATSNTSPFPPDDVELEAIGFDDMQACEKAKTKLKEFKHVHYIECFERGSEYPEYRRQY